MCAPPQSADKSIKWNCSDAKHIFVQTWSTPQVCRKIQKVFNIHWGFKFSPNIKMCCICMHRQCTYQSSWWQPPPQMSTPGLATMAVDARSGLVPCCLGRRYHKRLQDQSTGNKSCSLPGYQSRALWKPLQAWLHSTGLQGRLWSRLQQWKMSGMALGSSQVPLLSPQVDGGAWSCDGGRDGIARPVSLIY